MKNLKVNNVGVFVTGKVNVEFPEARFECLLGDDKKRLSKLFKYINRYGYLSLVDNDKETVKVTKDDIGDIIGLEGGFLKNWLMRVKRARLLIEFKEITDEGEINIEYYINPGYVMKSDGFNIKSFILFKDDMNNILSPENKAKIELDAIAYTQKQNDYRKMLKINPFIF